MNRRAFFASLAALPAIAKTAMKPPVVIRTGWIKPRGTGWAKIIGISAPPFGSFSPVARLEASSHLFEEGIISRGDFVFLAGGRSERRCNFSPPFQVPPFDEQPGTLALRGQS